MAASRPRESRRSGQTSNLRPPWRVRPMTLGEAMPRRSVRGCGAARAAQRSTGITNSAPVRTPCGQRAVVVFSRV